jgi:hypothetical protein
VIRRSAVGLVAAVMLSALAGSTPFAFGQQAPASEAVPVRIAIEAAADPTAARILDQAGALPFRVAVRIVRSGLDTDSTLDDSLRELAARQAPIWLAVPAPARVEEADAWLAALRQLLARHARALTILEVTIDDQPAALAAYAVRLASTEARAATGAAIRLAIGGRRMVSWRAARKSTAAISRPTSTCCRSRRPRPTARPVVVAGGSDRRARQ